MKFILSIDQGTTGTTAALIEADTLKFVCKVNKEFPQHFPKPGWVEHNLDDIWTTIGATITEVLTKSHTRADQIVTIGITNQRETICAFNKDGAQLHNALVWQDRRTSSFCASVPTQMKDKIKSLTGLPTDPYFSGTKMNWLLKNCEAVQEALKEDNLRFGTIDTYILYQLTSGESFATEASNASRTLIYDIHKNCWSQELCDFLEVPQKVLPEVKSSFGEFGLTKGLSFLPDGIPITGILGDQQSALFGQAGHEKGMSKCTYGTGAFFLLNTGNECMTSEGLLSTIAYRDGEDTYYALEGSSYIAGAAVQWLRDSLQIIESSPAVEALAKSASDESCENVLFLPFFSGLGSPYWVPEAQGAIVGLTRDTARPQIARACLEGITLSINDLISSVVKDSGMELKELRVDGGAVVNDFMMQIQANFSELEVVRPSIIETTAYGAACAAAIGAKLMSKEKLTELVKIDKVFTPVKGASYSIKKKELWANTIKKLYLN